MRVIGEMEGGLGEKREGGRARCGVLAPETRLALSRVASVTWGFTKCPSATLVASPGSKDRVCAELRRNE